MKKNIKSIFTCFIIFICSLFITNVSVNAEECKYFYGIDQNRFTKENMEKNVNDNGIRMTLLNFVANTNPSLFSADWYNTAGAPNAISFSLYTDDSTGNVKNAFLNVRTDASLDRQFDMTNDFANMKFSECPKTFKINIMCVNRLSVCGAFYGGNPVRDEGSVDLFSEKVFFTEYPYVSAVMLREATKDDKNDKIVSNCGNDTSEVENIFNKFPNELRSALKNISVRESMSEEDETKLKNLLNEQLYLSSYYDNCSSINSVVNQINSDAKKLKSFQDSFKSCYKKQDSELTDDLKINSINFGKFTYDDVTKIMFLLDDDRIGNATYTEKICNNKSVVDAKDSLVTSCTKWNLAGYSSYEECYNDNQKSIISQFNCEDIASYAMKEKAISQNTEDSSYLKIAVDYYENKCSNKNGDSKKQCIVDYCEDSKNSDENTSKTINEINNKMDDITETYNNANVNIYSGLVNISGIKTDTKICEFLYGKNGLGDYILGANNLIMIGGIILTIILSILDGIKTFASFKDEDSKKFFNNLKTRLICIVLLIIIPTIIYFLINLIGKTCGKN